MSVASQEEVQKVCLHAGTALKLLTEPMPVNDGEARDAGDAAVHVPQRVVVKADRMRRETLTQLLQSIINHPSISTVLEVSKDDLTEQMRRSQHDS